MSDSGAAGLAGGPVEIRIDPGNPEAAKYRTLWAMPEYRAVSPGEALVSEFLAVAKPSPESEVLDLGCGTGRAALLMAILQPGLRVTMIDFVANALDPEIEAALTTQAHVLRF